MQKKKSFLSHYCFAESLLTGYAQTVDEVINKHIEAMGGAEKLKSLKSLYMEGVAVMQNGNEIISKIYKVQDKLLTAGN